MRKFILIAMFSISPFMFANDGEEVSFFSSQTQSNSIGTVDDPDTPAAPINNSAYLLLIIAAGAGLIYFRNKSIKVIR